MGMIQIQISDDVKAALEKSYPGETIEAAVERLLKAEVAKQPVPLTSAEIEAFMERVRRIRESGPSVSDDEIRRLRHEGRP
jgi:DNA-binding IclR family transcriptional regulator